jgi:hypothetical protein
MYNETCIHDKSICSKFAEMNRTFLLQHTHQNRIETICLDIFSLYIVAPFSATPVLARFEEITPDSWKNSTTTEQVALESFSSEAAYHAIFRRCLMRSSHHSSSHHSSSHPPITHPVIRPSLIQSSAHH